MWKDYDVTFKAILSNLKQHSDLLDRLANALHISQSQKDSEVLGSFVARYTKDADNIRAQIDEHKTKQDRIVEAIERTDMEKKRTHKLEVLRWIAAASMTDWHEQFCKARQCCPGSGDWILESEKLKDWKDSDTPNNTVLWLHGIPGAGTRSGPGRECSLYRTEQCVTGKTVLASKIIESCMENTNFKTTYFYCRDNHDATTTCMGIFKGLIGQMVLHCEDLVPTCHDKLNTTGDMTLTTETVAKQLLELFCKTIPKQYIIIDGLDECEEKQRTTFLRELTTIVKACNEDPSTSCGKPRVLCVSRKIGDIERSLAEASWLEIKNANHKDIEAFVCYKLGELEGKFDLGQEPGLTGHLQQRIIIHANSMFLLPTPSMFRLRVTVRLYISDRYPNLLPDRHVSLCGISPGEFE